MKDDPRQLTFDDAIFASEAGSGVHKRLSVDDLSEDQLSVYEGIVDWLRGKSELGGNGILTIGGLGGSGKSTLVGVLAARSDLGLVAYATYTGRAASVLQRKLAAARVASTQRTLASKPFLAKSRSDLFFGAKSQEALMPYCGTLHKLLYTPVLDDKEQLRGWNRRSTLDRPYNLVVVDEASMVSDELLMDLRALDVPILAVGDHGQLPPVMASGDLMRNPMLRLRKIHRQAKGNPIIRLARRVRKTGELDEDLADGETIVFANRDAATISRVLKEAYAEAKSPLDVAVLCWTNRQRIRLNMAARRARFRDIPVIGAPRRGEVLICLKNIQGSAIYNGMRGILRSDTVEQGWELHGDLDFPDEGLTSGMLKMCAPQFNQERVFGDVDEANAMGLGVEKMSELGTFFDFGYAMTIHKSQGSQVDHVVFFVEDGAQRDEELFKRLAYTAVTRAAKKVTVLR